ncbi:hypothetical protein CEXT_420121 [Caerostris extrusa]|uniref:Uncharacterized protein n=1 Tax=Caerostris extrusa TaxID=172846 RepID=A0AAV4N832_CAEEX|nr:hypothetical protein CEXT_420121 [Caerostris extrusa]
MQISSSFHKAPPSIPLLACRGKSSQIASSRNSHHPAHNNVPILRQTRVASSRRSYPCGSLDPLTATAPTSPPFLSPVHLEILFSCPFVRYSLYALTPTKEMSLYSTPEYHAESDKVFRAINIEGHA